MHPRLNAVAVTGAIGIYNHEQALAELDEDQPGRALQ